MVLLRDIDEVKIKDRWYRKWILIIGFLVGYLGIVFLMQTIYYPFFDKIVDI